MFIRHLTIISLFACCQVIAAELNLQLRSRDQTSGIKEQSVRWEGRETAMVVCDMWDEHWCPEATKRVAEMAPVMNRVLVKAREMGVLIIHCPSDTLDFYKDHPGRKLCQNALASQEAASAAKKGPGWYPLNKDKEPPLPIDDSDGGCETELPSRKAWSRQHPALEIREGDGITANDEAVALLQRTGRKNIIVMGVHTNMCVLGRPFSIRRLVGDGFQVALMRDMTDALYNPKKAPYVSHFRGTELVVEHIEQHWCPSLTSADILGGKPFRFAADVRKKIVLVTGEHEYQTWETLPAFAAKELGWRGYEIRHVAAAPEKAAHDFKNWEALKEADLIVLSVRRRTPQKEMLVTLRSHLDSGKPLVAIRTASHAFDATPPDDKHAAWPLFDDEILGMDYQNHYGKKAEGPQVEVNTAQGGASSVLLTGVGEKFSSGVSLYKNRNPAPEVTVLLNGTRLGSGEVEPVAWTNTAAKRRIFATSLGGAEDFAEPNFRRLLLNGILWALGDALPPSDVKPRDFP